MLGAVVVSLVVYAVSFFLLRLLSRYRELCADRAGAYLTMGARRARLRAAEDLSGEMAAIPQKDLRVSKAMNAFFIAPAITGATVKTLTATHPSLEQRLEQLARIQAELARPRRAGDLGRAYPGCDASRTNLDALFHVPNAAITLQTAAGLTPTGTGSVCFRCRRGGVRQTRTDVVELIDADPTRRTSGDHRRLRLHLADRGTGRPRRRRGHLHRPARRQHRPGGAGVRVRPPVLAGPVRRPGGRRVGLVYLYRQGTFYPFAPSGPQQRDNLLEIQVRDALAVELPIEKDLRAGWRSGCPGL